MRTVLTLALLMGVTACATTGASGRRSNADRITRAELEESHQVNAYDVIRSLRPQWLRIRGASSFNYENPIQVYVDGQRYGTVDELSSLSILSIDSLRYFDPTEAQARWGLNNTNGAIEVTTRRR